jgi:hypothetical protein
MRLPTSVRERFRAYGRAGGRARASRMSPGARRAVARRAAMQRWIQARFGVRRFHAAGLPGGEVIDAGLAALADGEESIESLVVSIAASRLRREGVPLPREIFANAEIRLFRLLEQNGEPLAHARYLAYLRQAQSFADACARVRMI